MAVVVLSAAAACGRIGFDARGDSSEIDSGAIDSNPPVNPFADGTVHYLKPSQPDATDRFGASVAISADGTTLAVGATQEDSTTTGINSTPDNGGNDIGAAYVFVRSGGTWIEQAYFKPQQGDGGDLYGWSIALSRDGNTLAVGTQLEDSASTGTAGNPADNNASGAGAVYVYTRAGNVWSQQAYLKASNTNAGDHFGNGVALAEDGNTLVVGAPGEASAATGVGGSQVDNSMAGAGAAYVFVRVGAVWSQQAYLKASDTSAGADFGFSVDLSADGDTLAVGAELANGSGAAYVFTRTGSTWAAPIKETASAPDAGDWFGYSIDVTPDGKTLLAGAPHEFGGSSGIDGDPSDNSLLNAGAVYMFTRVGNTWTQSHYLKAEVSGNDDEFGWRVTADSTGSTIVVGALGEDGSGRGFGSDPNDNAATDSGALYVFGTGTSLDDIVKAPNTDAGDFFGVRAMVTSDGRTLAVSAFLEDSMAATVDGDQTNNGSMDSGAVYVFDAP